MTLRGVIEATILMILLAGIVGGAINCLQARKPDELIPKSRGYYFLLSIAAAFSVPLFLSLTKSELLRSVLKVDQSNIEDWFILFAMCLVAAIYAQSFLETVSKNLLQRVQDAVNTSQKAALTADKALNKAEAAGEHSLNATTDAAATARFAKARAATGSASAPLDSDRQKVLDALKNPNFQLGRRTIGGIVAETKLSRPDVSGILDKLIAEGVVEKEREETSDSEFYVLRAPAG
jgi:hypothetical protein